MTKEQIIKDQFPNDEFLQGGVLQVVNKCTAALEEENKKLKKKFSHNCPSCVAFGKHCPHKVNGDPYFYDCYLTVKDLEKENAKAKELLKKWQQVDICDAAVLFADTEEFLKEKL